MKLTGFNLFGNRFHIDKSGIGLAKPWSKDKRWYGFVFPEWLHHLLGYCPIYHKHWNI